MTVASRLPSSFGATIYFCHWIKHHNGAVVLSIAEIFSMASWNLGSVALKVSIFQQSRYRGEFGESSMKMNAGAGGNYLRAFVFTKFQGKDEAKQGVKERAKARLPGGLSWISSKESRPRTLAASWSQGARRSLPRGKAQKRMQAIQH